MKNNKKGFTLAELLVVVAIIAVLVAIAIPVFTAQLEKSREAVDAANIRSAYAEIMINVVSGEGATTKDVKLKQQTAGWGTTFEWPENLNIGSYDPQPNATVKLTYNSSTSKIDVQ